MSKGPGGAPCKWNPIEAVEPIAELLAQGKFLTEICQGEGMPDIRPVYTWEREIPEIRHTLTCARMEGADNLVREAETMLRTEVPPDTDKEQTRFYMGRMREFCAHVRWRASKLSSTYADQKNINLTGAIEHDHKVSYSDSAPAFVKDRLTGPTTEVVEGDFEEIFS